MGRALASAAGLACLAFGVGFLFHTSLDPVLLGKYSLGYALFLGAWFLLLVPCVFLLARFAFRTDEIVLGSGRTLHFRPSLKLLLLACVAGLLWGLISHRISKEVGRGTTTRADVFHPFLQNVPRPQSASRHTNQWGFRGDEIEKAAPEGARRVFIFGGSTVFCGRLPYEKTHAYLLEQHLRRVVPWQPIQVQNVGADWHSSQHSVIRYLFDVADFKPDVVIIYHGINDLYRSLSPDLYAQGAYRRDYGHYHGPLATLVRPEKKWWLLGLAYGHWFSDFRHEKVRVTPPPGSRQPETLFFPKAKPVAVRQWPSLEAFERNLRRFIRVARGDGVQVVVASQPYLYREDLPPAARERIWFPLAQQAKGTRPSIRSMIEGMERFNAVSRRVASEEGVGFVNLEAVVPKTTDYFVDDVHYTPRACARIAKAFAEHLQVLPGLARAEE